MRAEACARELPDEGPAVMADVVDDTAVAPDAAATLASPPAAAVLAPPAPSPSLDGDIQQLIQNMVRQRVADNWPFVRAFECGRDVSSVRVGEWVAFTFSSLLDDDDTLVGKVLKVGVHSQTAVQSDYWKPPEFVVVSVYARVPGTAYFVKWSPVAVSAKYVHQSALVAVGFSMQLVDGLPLSWPLELRRPSGRRRLGPAYVMDASVQAQLSSLGPLTEIIPEPAIHGEPVSE